MFYISSKLFELQIESDEDTWWKEDEEVVERGVNFMKWYLLTIVHDFIRL